MVFNNVPSDSKFTTKLPKADIIDQFWQGENTLKFFCIDEIIIVLGRLVIHGLRYTEHILDPPSFNP